MRLTWHIVWKDLRRLKWALMMLLALTAAKLGIGVLALRGSDMIWNFGIGGSLLLLVEIMVSYVLVAAFVQEDSLVDNCTDWQTRPISGGRLLVAKLIGLILALAVMPLVLLVPWWVGCGFGAEDLVFALRDHVGWALAILLVGLPIAVVTDGYARFLLWTTILVLGAIGFGLLVAGKFTGVAPELVKTRLWIGAGLLGIISIIVTVSQFLRRTTQRSARLLGFGTLVTAAVTMLWPWVAMEAPRPPQKRIPTKGLTLMPERLELRGGPTATSSFQSYLLKGLPDDMIVIGGTADQTYRWSDNAIVSIKGKIDFDLELPRKAFGLEPRSTQAGELRLSANGSGAPQTLSKRLVGEAAMLSGNVQLYLWRVRLTNEHATTKGAQWREGSRAQWVTAVKSEDRDAVMTVLERRPAHSEPEMAVGIVQVFFTRDTYFFVNRELGRLRFAAGARSEGLRIAAVTLRRTVVKFSPRESDPFYPSPEDRLRDWKLDRAETISSETVQVPIVPTSVMVTKR